MTQEHPFAQYVRILGKGPNLSRALTEAETVEAVRMILAGTVEPVQLGAFLCLLRVRTEEPPEAAGFVRAVKASLARPEPRPRVDLDWPSYAGKSRQLPWFLLAARLLADNGVTVCLHGEDGHTDGRLYARDVLGTVDIPEAASLDDAARLLGARRICYLPLAALCPPLHAIMELKPLLGLRSPIHTFARLINPFDAPASVHGIVHVAYRDLHREAAALVGQPRLAVFKGEGGEAERRPTKPVLVQCLFDGQRLDEDWPATLDETNPHDEIMDPKRLTALWRGETADAYGEAAVIGTTAIALRTLGRAAAPAEAEAQAAALWRARRIKAE